MHNELTRQDMQELRAELEHRRIELRPQLIQAVKEARAFGDLSENFEYKAAKQEKNRNDSRIRYLENMLKTARVIDDTSSAGQVGLNDLVTIWLEDEDEAETFQLVTTLQQDALRGKVSKESPVGKALMGRAKGDRVYVQLENGGGYYAVIRDILKK